MYGLTETSIEVLQAFAKCDMRTHRTAKKLHVATGTVAYHLQKIEDKTGLNPYKFYDLLKLLGYDNSNLLNTLKKAKTLLNELCEKCGTIESEDAK